MKLTRRNDVGLLLAAGLAAVSIGAIIAGLMLVGGPGKARDEKADDRLLTDLITIASQIECFVESSGSLPASLEELYAVVKVEPWNRPTDECQNIRQVDEARALEAISYSLLSGQEARLCARFKRSSPAVPPSGSTLIYYPRGTDTSAFDRFGFGQDREHGGEQCYTGRWNKIGAED